MQDMEKTLLQVKSTGADVFEFFPTQAMMDADKEKIEDLKKMLAEMEIEPVFTFGYPQGWDILSEEEEISQKAIQYLQKAIKGIGLLGGKADWGNCIWKLASRLYQKPH